MGLLVLPWDFSSCLGSMPAPLASKRNKAMNYSVIDQTEEAVLYCEVSDEALETAAGTGKEKADYTLGACTGLSVCGA
jgi:hypothetical protein